MIWRCLWCGYCTRIIGTVLDEVLPCPECNDPLTPEGFID